jgi:hypothetical protein
MILILILVAIIFITVYILIRNEPFTKTISEFFKDVSSNVIKTNQLSSDLPFTAISPVQMITDDTLFNDTKLIKGDGTLTGEIGLEKCIKTCDGMCVEYGITGDAFCFPRDDSSAKDKYVRTVKEKYSFKF